MSALHVSLVSFHASETSPKGVRGKFGAAHTLLNVKAIGKRSGIWSTRMGKMVTRGAFRGIR